MIQNERKEPTFGEKNVTDAKNIAPSLRTKQSPGHTFTPVIKPAGAVKLELPKMEGGEASQPAGFAFSPVSETQNHEPKVEKIKESIEEKMEGIKAGTGNVKSVAQDTAKVAMNAAERVIPTSSKAKVENEVIKNSSKCRLGLIALLVAVFCAICFWLKPNAPETVEELQSQQSGNLPIEFRPVDESEAQRQEAEAKAQAQIQAQQDVAPQQTQVVQQERISQPPAHSQQSENATVNTKGVMQPVEPISNELAQPQTQVIIPVVEKPKTQGSVAFQPEGQTTQGASHHSIVHRVERVRPQNSVAPAKIKAVTKAEFDAKKAQNTQLDRLVKNVESSKLAKELQAPSVVAKKEVAQIITSTVASSKTLIVPKGVSLMQVFRDNQLNISDVNAMSKVNNKVSNLKVNEKVTVQLDKNNRVVEMAIGSGGKFIRLANGSYQFK